jgi:PIN domain nuclease of toxin-antitoxin system
MKLLLDTHIFLWMNDDPQQLTQTVKTLCSSGEHEFFLSMASPWEMQIKSQMGTLSLAMPIDELVSKNRLENNIKLLPIELSHISYLEQLPQHHKDPFDHIIIAQAIIEGMTVITVDHAFDNYFARVMW